MTIEEANDLCLEIAEKNAADRMADYLSELEEESLDRMMAEHEQMLYACMSYDLDAEYYGK
jgi:hypothetical protein